MMVTHQIERSYTTSTSPRRLSVPSSFMRLPSSKTDDEATASSQIGSLLFRDNINDHESDASSSSSHSSLSTVSQTASQIPSVVASSTVASSSFVHRRRKTTTRGTPKALRGRKCFAKKHHHSKQGTSNSLRNNKNSKNLNKISPSNSCSSLSSMMRSACNTTTRNNMMRMIPASSIAPEPSLSSILAQALSPPLWTDSFASDVTTSIKEEVDMMIEHGNLSSSPTGGNKSERVFWNDLTSRDIIRRRNDHNHDGLLGSGSFSDVTLCSIKRSGCDSSSNAYYAMKSLRRDLLPRVLPQVLAQDDDDGTGSTAGFIKAAQELAREAYLLSRLDHPHIIAIRGWTAGGVASYEQYKRHDAFFLVLDLLHKETLGDRIQRWNREDRHAAAASTTALTYPHETDRTVEQLTICRQIANALEYIHSKKIVYRDLKPDNIGFVASASDGNNQDTKTHVKLMDFGLACELPSIKKKQDEGQQQRTSINNDVVATATTTTTAMLHNAGMVGTIRYMSPEVYLNKPYGLKADIYSWSIVSYEVLTKELPFDNMIPEEFYRHVCQQGVRPNSWDETTGTVIEDPTTTKSRLPSDYLVLLAHAWRTDPEKRLSLAHIQQYLDLFLQKETLVREENRLVSNRSDRSHRCTTAAAASTTTTTNCINNTNVRNDARSSMMHQQQESRHTEVMNAAIRILSNDSTIMMHNNRDNTNAVVAHDSSNAMYYQQHHYQSQQQQQRYQSQQQRANSFLLKQQQQRQFVHQYRDNHCNFQLQQQQLLPPDVFNMYPK